MPSARLFTQQSNIPVKCELLDDDYLPSGVAVRAVVTVGRLHANTVPSAAPVLVLSARFCSWSFEMSFKVLRFTKALC